MSNFLFVGLMNTSMDRLRSEPLALGSCSVQEIWSFLPGE